MTTTQQHTIHSKIGRFAAQIAVFDARSRFAERRRVGCPGAGRTLAHGATPAAELRGAAERRRTRW